MVPVAGQDRAHLGARLARKHVDLVQVLVLLEQPARLGQADDDLVVLAHAFADEIEIVALGVVEIALELDVRAPDPPIVRQLDRKIAAMLHAAPSADGSAYAAGDAIARGAEYAVERIEPVVPVMVARQGEQLALRLVRRIDGERRVVRLDEDRESG